jgi:hypothetical protein
VLLRLLNGVLNYLSGRVLAPVSRPLSLISSVISTPQPRRSLTCSFRITVVSTSSVAHSPEQSRSLRRTSRLVCGAPDLSSCHRILVSLGHCSSRALLVPILDPQAYHRTLFSQMAERLKTEKEDRKAARAARAAKKRAAKKARKEKGLSDTDFNDLSDFSGDSSDLNEDDDAEPEFELPEEAREYLVRVCKFVRHSTRHKRMHPLLCCTGDQKLQ